MAHPPPQSNRPPVGVAVVSYNTRELLHACLASLHDCTLPLRVVVVDNASRDGSAALVREAFPTIELIAEARNLGFAAATNVGLRKLMCDPAIEYLLLLNPDTIVHTGAIEELAAFLDAHPRVGAAGPRLLNTDGTLQTAAFRFPTLAMTAIDLFPPGEVLPGRLYGSWWHGRYPQEGADEPFAIDHPLGACILARRSAVEEVGLLDEGFFMYAEEVEWCFRMRRAGWAIWQVPAALVTHVGGAATSQFRARMLVALWSSRMRFLGMAHSAPLVRAHRTLLRAGMLRLALIAWRDYVRGRIDTQELRARLWAYGEASRL
jgi:hypothetical protein